MKISNRALGYISFLVIIGVFAYISYSMYEAHQSVIHTATVDFKELGSLQPEDPVVVRGYKVGTIGSVTWMGDRARITIKFDEPIVLREGSEFNNVNFALMGQRRLEIVPSKTGKVMPDDYVFSGSFEPGIAEGLRLIENVNTQLAVIRDAIIILAEGDSIHKSAPETFENTLSAIESFLDNADQEVERLSPQLKTLFDQVEQAGDAIEKATIKADTAVKVATTAVNEKLEKLQSAINTISDGAEKTNKIITDVEKNALETDLLTTTETLEKVNLVIDKMNKLIKAINTKGIKIYDKDGKPVKLIRWQNMNIIGQTARSKAKERAEKAAKSQNEATAPADTSKSKP